jgi:hypothetical protein
VPVSYFVQYSTSYAAYNQGSPPNTTTLPANGNTFQTMTLSNLQPNTTYHYRAQMISSPSNLGQFTSYSGADQTFTTGPGVGSTPRRIDTIAPARASRLRITGSRAPGQPVKLTHVTGTALQGWQVSNPNATKTTQLVNAKTRLCLDDKRHSRAYGAPIISRSATAARPHNSGSRSS